MQEGKKERTTAEAIRNCRPLPQFQQAKEVEGKRSMLIFVKMLRKALWT